MHVKQVVWICLFIVSGIFYYSWAESSSAALSLHNVGRVIDGDTFESVEGHKFRLKGINTPEEGYAYSADATLFLEDIILGKAVDVENYGVDKYGRFLVHTFAGGVLVNEEILRQGLGMLYYYEHDAHYDSLAQAEAYAREQEIGVWKKSPHASCVELIELRYVEPGKRCTDGERLVLRNSCAQDIAVVIKDDATHLYKEVLKAASVFEKSFSCIFNDDGDSLYVWDDEGLLVFERY